MAQRPRAHLPGNTGLGKKSHQQLQLVQTRGRRLRDQIRSLFRLHDQRDPRWEERRWAVERNNRPLENAPALTIRSMPRLVAAMARARR